MTMFAIVFPGQGSQAVGMLDGWGDHPAVRHTLEEASQALGEDIAVLIRHGPKERLDLTTNTQPVMLATGIACWRAWVEDTGLLPCAMAGHSLGEYSALVAAGSLAFADALGLVRLRAQAMQDAVPVGEGGMAAILGIEADAVREGCAEAARATGRVVQAVNFNDPRQTVIAGDRQAVERACTVLKAMGAKRALPLPVSAPFHCSLMRPAADRLREALATTRLLSPQIPVVNNIDVRPETDPERIRDALFRQAWGPVRWVEVVQAIHALGVGHVIECGPGKVLAGMVKRIAPDIVAAAVFDPASLADARGQLA